MFEAPPLTPHGPPGNARLFSSDTSRQPRILLWGRAGRSDRGGGARRVSRGGLGRCECVGGRAGRGHTASSEPSANSPGAAGHAHHGRGPPHLAVQPPRTLVSAARALRRAWRGRRQRAREGARGSAGDLEGGGIAGWALGRPLPPPAQPSRPPGAPDQEARARGGACALSLLGARLLPVESGSWVRPLLGHLSFLLLRKPPA